MIWLLIFIGAMVYVAFTKDAPVTRTIVITTRKDGSIEVEDSDE